MVVLTSDGAVESELGGPELGRPELGRPDRLDSMALPKPNGERSAAEDLRMPG